MNAGDFRCTFETCRGGLTMSVDRGEPEVASWRSIRRDSTAALNKPGVVGILR
jgi:hypothetical protein